MRQKAWSPYQTALQYVGVSEIAGELDNPLILAMLGLQADWPKHDEVPWCSAFVGWIAWHWAIEREAPEELRLLARSWLLEGEEYLLAAMEPGFDIVVLKRGSGEQPPASTIEAPGHVGFFSRLEGDRVWLLGGNQGDKVSIQSFPTSRILGTRRLG